MMDATALAAAPARPRTRVSRRWRAAVVGHLYLAPAIVLTGLFVYWPLGISFS